MQKRNRKLNTAQSIRETIDNLPGGICLSMPNGRPILTNLRMNDLIFRLTGHTIMNAQTTWDELGRIDSANGCTKLDELRLELEDANEITADGSILFQFPNEQVWKFCREELTDQKPVYIQLDASDISDLYRYSRELYETNQRLAEQYRRQRNLLANIVEINHEKEILRAKMRIHDDLGQSLLFTKQQLLDDTLSENLAELTGTWDNTIRSLSEFTEADVNDDISPEAELRRAADMIGCRLNFSGDKPVGRRPVLLFYATVRAALTNAVRHANADQLNIAVTQTDSGYHVVISDNGTVQALPVTEGNGLANLRKRLEEEGATLEIKCDDGVVLIIDLPAERRKTQR